MKYTKNDLQRMVSDKVEILEFISYTGYLNSKATFKCKKCDHKWENTIQKINKNQSNCSECRYAKKRSDIFHVKKILEDKNIIALFDLSEYKNNRITYCFKCGLCSEIFKNSIGNIISQNNGCPNCSKRKKYSEDFIRKKLKELQITLISVPKKFNVKTKLLCKCDKCEHVWSPTFEIYSGKHGCPACKYKNEGICAKILKEYGIESIKKRISNTFYETNRNTTKFFIVDFYFVYNDKTVIIEYNGMQHYKPINFTGKQTKIQLINNFEKQKNRDEDLRKMCQKENIILIEIDGRYSEGYESIKQTIKEKFRSIS